MVRRLVQELFDVVHDGEWNSQPTGLETVTLPLIHDPRDWLFPTIFWDLNGSLEVSCKR